MSNSRLEKFIYAICGMDVDDLPTPLSRIETLWNCLITGETPDFEPLSRNEKYLMAMLSGDIDGLPEPTSRSEKLLYKIATGETDLSDVPGYLSRYEELLKQLIENGGIGGTDFEYVLYTLNQHLSTLYTTAEGPVKSAILKGCTLVNLVTTDTSNGYTLINDGTGIKGNRLDLIDGFDNKNYTFVLEFSDVNIVNENPDWGVYITVLSLEDKGADNLTIKSHVKNGKVTFLYRPSRQRKTINNFSISLHSDSGVGSTITITNVVVLEGDYTNVDIPYFTGMKSVRMPVLTITGKNLFNPNQKINQGYFINSASGDDQPLVGYATTDYLKILPNTVYTNYYTNHVAFYDENKTFIRRDVTWTNSNGAKITSPSNAHYVRIQLEISQIPNGDYSQIGFICGDYTYEPYKTNILSCNEEVTLPGIGEVKDALDGNTGELTQRIGEVVLDGSENWLTALSGDGFYRHYYKESTIGVGNVIADHTFTNLKNIQAINNNTILNKVGTHGEVDGYIYVGTHLNVSEFKNFLSTNPLIIQYPLSEKTIKTVVLSITDQDGQPTKLKTFNDVTHVSIEAEDLLPTVDLEVPTKIEETLSTLPTLMYDISETQQLLNESIDDQAENIKEVSTAMIEIRNDIL